MERATNEPQPVAPGSLGRSGQGRTRLRRFFPITLAVVMIAAVGWGAFWLHKGVIAPSGGLYFPVRKQIEGPTFLQNDSRWGDDLLGNTQGLLGAEGCAVSSAAMILGAYGIDTDPGRLNQFLRENGGFTERGWLCWEKAVDLAPDRVRFTYEDLPSFAWIDLNLLLDNPVIVRLRLKSGITHFVVICGKQGFDYLIRDPAARGKDGSYPLREVGSPIEALRFYQRRLPF